MRHPDQIKQYLKEDEFKVYTLIWQRFIASQITPAVFDQTTIDIDAKTTSDVFWFRVTGSVVKFDGFLKVYKESKEGKDEEDEELKHKLPPLEAGQKLTLKSVNRSSISPNRRRGSTRPRSSRNWRSAGSDDPPLMLPF